MTRLSVSQTIPCMASLKSSCATPSLKGVSTLPVTLCSSNDKQALIGCSLYMHKGHDHSELHSN